MRSTSSKKCDTFAEGMATRDNQPERAKKAHDRSEALKPRVATLTIIVSDGARVQPGFEIRRDGLVAGSPSWGVAIPVDRGSHFVVATAVGKVSSSQVVEVTEEGSALSVSIEPLTDTPLPPPVVSASQPYRPPPAKPKPRFWSGARIAGATLAVGVIVIMGIGGHFVSVAIAKRDQSNAGPCNELDRCNDEGLGLRQEALHAAGAATGLFVAGSVAAAGGVALFAAAPALAGSPATVALGPAGLQASMRW